MSKNDEGPIIGIDLGTIFSCVGIMRNDRVDIVPEAYSGRNIIPSTVCFTPTKILIGTVASNKMRQFPESSMFESQRLIKAINKKNKKNKKRFPFFQSYYKPKNNVREWRRSKV